MRQGGGYVDGRQEEGRNLSSRTAMGPSLPARTCQGPTVPHPGDVRQREGPDSVLQCREFPSNFCRSPVCRIGGPGCPSIFLFDFPHSPSWYSFNKPSLNIHYGPDALLGLRATATAPRDGGGVPKYLCVPLHLPSLPDAPVVGPPLMQSHD